MKKILAILTISFSFLLVGCVQQDIQKFLNHAEKLGGFENISGITVLKNYRILLKYGFTNLIGDLQMQK